MASVVDLCNVSLSNLGQRADITAIDPPDGGAYAVHCARYYPIARDLALESHPWNFAIRRKALVQPAGVDAPTSWEEVFALPSDVIRPIAILPEGYTNESSQRLQYEIEGQYLYCNEEGVTMKYIARVTDTTLWTPSFFDAVAWKLSHLLAGVIVKGDSGLRGYMLKQYEQALSVAMGHNANSANVRIDHMPIWMSDR